MPPRSVRCPGAGLGEPACDRVALTLLRAEGNQQSGTAGGVAGGHLVREQRIDGERPAPRTSRWLPVPRSGTPRLRPGRPATAWWRAALSKCRRKKSRVVEQELERWTLLSGSSKKLQSFGISERRRVRTSSRLRSQTSDPLVR